MTEVQLPYMRQEIVSALEALSSRDRQARWGRFVLGDSYQEDLTQVVHTLYDDTAVLPDPETEVGVYVFSEEVEPLRALSAVLSPLLAELGESSDDTYLADHRWPDVVRAATAALSNMRP